jgi:hypothetical protein
MKLPVTYRGATPADDGEMRAFLHRSPSGGDVRLRIEKEPSFHEAFEVEGERGDILLANDVDTGAIVGVGARAAKRAFVNGRMEPLGYLSTLRIDSAYRGGKVLKAGYIRFKEFHDAGRARLYTTTIMTSNVIAVRALTQGRPGLPLYNDYGGYVTHILGVRRNPFKARGNVTIRQAKAPDALAMQEFWRREGEKRQFFPLYTARHVVEPGGLLRGLNVWDFMVAERDGTIVGTIALWNQMPFRQWIIDGYSRRAGMVMPAYNLFAKATGRPTFPKGGEALDYRFLSLFVVADNDEKVALSLLSKIWKRAHDTAPESLLVAGIHERAPLAHLLQRPKGVRFHSRLFVVHWDDGKEAFAALDDRVPYLEVGSL